MSKAIVFLEVREDKIKKSSVEALATALSFKGKVFDNVEAVSVYANKPDLSALKGLSPDLVHVFTNNSFVNYVPQSYKKALLEVAGASTEVVFFFSNTSMGKDLAPRIAASLECGLAMDLIDLKFENDNFIATRPVYAGKAIEDLQINTAIKVFTLRPNVFPAKPVGEEITGNIIETQVAEADLSVNTVSFKKAEGKLDVSEASIIVSGGRGLKGPENYHLIESLAEVLGAAVGASRAVVDAGWRQHREQVGQTGKTVSPSLYIACGISGAIQHLAGMSTSKYIVAINKDKDAPIFQIADYGITGDALELIPVFIEEVKKIKG